jgi:hypothetical protein
MRIREQDTQHNTQQERTQSTNSNEHARQGNLRINNISNEREDSGFLMVIILVETYGDGLLNV